MKLPQRAGSRAVTLATLMLGLLGTIAAYGVCTALLKQDTELRFNNDTTDVIQQLDTRIRLYTDVLVTMQALFGASENVSRIEFRDFVNGLNLPTRYPGFQALNYAPYVPAAALDAFVARQRSDPQLRDAGVEFTVHPPGTRPGYFVLSYIEPLAENLPSVGIDMGAEPRRLQALEKSRDSGEAISSGRLIFSEAKHPHVGIALRMPVYRKGMRVGTVAERQQAYVGSVGAGIRAGDLLSGLVGSETLRRTRFQVYDAGDIDGTFVPPAPSRLLYDSRGGLSAQAETQAKGGAAAPVASLPDSGASDTSRHLASTVTHPFGGRRWLIVFTADARAISGPQRYLGSLVLGAGLVITLLLTGLAYALSSSRSRALAVADRMTQSLRDSRAALAQAQRIARVGNWQIDFDHDTAGFSGEMARLLGVPAATRAPAALLDAIDPACRDVLVQRMEAALAERGSFELECPYRSARGRKGWLHILGRAHGSAASRTLQGTAQDVTQRKSAEHARAHEHRIALLLSTASSTTQVLQEIVAGLVDGMEWDAGAFWLSEAGRALDLLPVGVAGTPELEAWLKRRPDTLQSAQGPLADEPRWYASHHAIEQLAHHDWLGEQRILTVFAFPLRRGSVTLGHVELYARSKRVRDRHALAMASGIASQTSHFLLRSEAEENLRYMANHDNLTGLPNRLMFKDYLERRLPVARSHERSLSVLYIDLDQFKVVNDTMGHNAGDALLCEVANRMRAALPDADMIARLGGDEFVVLVEPRHDPALVGNALRSIQEALGKALLIAGKELHVTASIGISCFPQDAGDAQTLLKYADMAMYSAKQQGKNSYQFYAHQMSESLQRRIDMEAHLRRALAQGEFELHYQPRISLKTDACTAVEALIRWRHPEFGLILPGEFIPYAEDTGIIVDIGAWALREACRQNAQWRAEGLPQLRVAVNLSARQFADKDLKLTILEALRQADLPGHALELELTESMLMHDAEQAARWLSALKRTGVRLAIDDFGTGYSSLAYLSRFPIDLVKVDRSFIHYLPESRNDLQITSAVIGLGHRLGLEVIAEGVENELQLGILRREGCDEVQGYYFSRPLAATDIPAFLASRTPPGKTDGTDEMGPRRLSA